MRKLNDIGYGAMNTSAMVLGLLLLLVASLGHAHGDEDHAHEDNKETPHPVAVTSVAPRFEARSDLFELVGVLHDEELVLYLDQAANNQSIVSATIEVESGAFKAQAMPAKGEFRFAAGALAQPGKHALTITVQTDSDIDLLAAQFEVPSASSMPVSEVVAGAFSPLLYGLIAVIALLVVALLWRGKRETN